jgi:fermentation-respiration switch protein FrsA (DUF1100 family)
MRDDYLGLPSWSNVCSLPDAVFAPIPVEISPSMPHLTQPLLIIHGENDRNIPLTDAHRAIDAAGSADKELRTFTTAAGGAGHVNTDDPDPTRQYIADWFAGRLGTEQPAT